MCGPHVHSPDAICRLQYIAHTCVLYACSMRLVRNNIVIVLAFRQYSVDAIPILTLMFGNTCPPQSYHRLSIFS